MLLNSYAFLSWETEGTNFWILLGLFVLSFCISMAATEEKPFTIIITNLACAGLLYLYSGMSGEVFWFINIEKVGWILWFVGFMLTAILFGLVIGNFWGHLKLASSIFSDFWVGFVGLVIACVWGYLLIRLGKIVFDEHPIQCVITLLGGLSGQAKSSSYTPSYGGGDSGSGGGGGGSSPEPEPDPYPDPTPDPEPDGPYSPQGFPCCDNCRWNMNRGSYFVRCFQDGSREKEPNDKCTQWQRC